MLKKLLAVLAVVMFAVSLTAHNTFAIEPNHGSGSISVMLEEGVNGTTVKGVEFELIKIGEIIDGLYEYTEEFADEETDLNKVETSEDLQELAVKLDKNTIENNIEGCFEKTNSKGYLKFSRLEVGIYLLRVSDYAKYEYVEPTLITVPTYDEDSQNSMKYDVTVIPKHTPFKISISKQDITTSKELPGAHLEIADKDGNIVDKWVSTVEPHMITNLAAGQTYTLTEVIAPDGYSIAQSIVFKVEKTGEVQKVTMYDELLPSSGGLKTGDDTNINAAIATAISGLSLIVYVYYRKKFNK